MFNNNAIIAMYEEYNAERPRILLSELAERYPHLAEAAAQIYDDYGCNAVFAEAEQNWVKPGEPAVFCEYWYSLEWGFFTLIEDDREKIQ